MPGRMHKVKRVRVIASLAVVGALVAVFFFVPLPFHVDCEFDVKPRDATTVYAAVAGRLANVTDHLESGARVRKGTVLAELENIDLELSVAQLEGQLSKMDAKLQVLEKQRRFDESAGLRINELKRQRNSLVELLNEQKSELDRLTVRAPADGVVLPVANKPERDPPDGQLPRWQGNLMSATNRNAYLSPSDKICQIGDPGQLVAELIIDQGDVELVRAAMAQRRRNGEPGVPVKLMLDSLPSVVLETDIERIALAELTHTPVGLSTHAGGDVDSEIDQETGMPKPLSTSYPAIAPLPEDAGNVQLGMRGKAKLYTGWQPLASRLYRFLSRTFHFEL